MYLAVLSLCVLLCGSISGLILPIKSQMVVQMSQASLSHVTLLEQTVTTLQKTTGQLQTDLQVSKAQSAAQIATLTKEVDSLKAELKLSSNDIAVLKSEMNDMKRITSNTNNQLNLTILDWISHDVKMNTAQVNAFQTDVNMLGKQLSLVNATVDDVKRETDRCIQNTSSAIQLITQQQAELQSTKTLTQSTSQQLMRLELELNSTSAGLLLTQNNFISTSTDVTTLRGDLSAVKNQSQDNKQSLAKVKQDLKLLADVHTTNISLETLSADLAAVKTQSEDNKKLVAALASKTRNVAFQVSSPTSKTPAFTALTFIKTLYNAGSAFNTTTGRFSAPESGTYMFWTKLEMVESNTNMNVYIMKSGRVSMAGGYVATDSNIYVADSSAVAVDHLSKGRRFGWRCRRHTTSMMAICRHTLVGSCCQ
ncbi:uncharacterized protein LOC124252804 [Haliotis rubra]|uniref:uncharacterized protein LOC124252804 n=1 Tax=Haliotis rubra TaxID=36100 RepID=UPI001EE62C84|nr:uncharacterized protein LOC124252804 [Haliotis rubra]